LIGTKRKQGRECCNLRNSEGSEIVGAEAFFHAAEDRTQGARPDDGDNPNQILVHGALRAADSTTHGPPSDLQAACAQSSEADPSTRCLSFTSGCADALDTQKKPDYGFPATEKGNNSHPTGRVQIIRPLNSAPLVEAVQKEKTRDRRCMPTVAGVPSGQLPVRLG